MANLPIMLIPRHYSAACAVKARERESTRKSAPGGAKPETAHSTYVITAPDGKRCEGTGETAEGALSALQQMLGDTSDPTPVEQSKRELASPNATNQEAPHARAKPQIGGGTILPPAYGDLWLW